MSLLIQKDGHEITTVDEWFQFSPPKEGKHQWVDGRSAKELAKVFLERGFPAVPPELRALLSSHPDVGPVDLTIAFPEHKIALDKFPGEPRNADLAAVGDCGMGKVAVNIEAKADEAFGDTIGDRLASASTMSNVPKRITALAEALLGHAGQEIHGLRYQLLHGIAASMIFAREQGASAAIFVALEFHGPSCAKENIERNRTDFELFVKALVPRGQALIPGRLSGPFQIPGGDFVPSGLPLYIGKVIRNVS
jgi:hypothetical protein